MCRLESCFRIFRHMLSSTAVMGIFFHDEEDPVVDGLVPWTVATLRFEEILNVLSGVLVLLLPVCVIHGIFLSVETAG
jgi:hypothetical protein